MPKYLSTADVAELCGLETSAIRTYLTRGTMADPDIRVGQVPGWLPETIEAWRANRPGRGKRTDLPPVRPALAFDALEIRELCALETVPLDGVRPIRAGRRPLAAHASAMAQRLHEQAPWAELAAAMGDGFAEDDGPLDEAQRAFVVGVAARHLLAAQHEVEDFVWPRRTGDRVAIGEGASALLRYAGLLRFVALLTRDTSEL